MALTLAKGKGPTTTAAGPSTVPPLDNEILDRSDTKSDDDSEDSDKDTLETRIFKTARILAGPPNLLGTLYPTINPIRKDETKRLKK